MKRYLLVIAITLVSLTHLNAQDIIYLFNTSTIEAVVENVADDSISYRLYSDPYGPLYTTSLVNVNYVRFEDGKTQYFSQHKVASEPYYQKMIYLKGNLYLDGEKLKSKKLSEQNLPTIYMSDFNSAKSLQGIGTTCNIVGGLFLAMGTVFLLPDFNGEPEILACYWGVGGMFLAGGITLTVLGNKSLKKIAASYNANSESSSNKTLTLGTCANGFGLAFNF